MDLRGKGIFVLSSLFILFGMLIMYTRIGGLGMIYFAGSMEIFFIITYFFLGGVPDAVEYMVKIREKKEQFEDAAKTKKAVVIYISLATVIIECLLIAINRYLVYQSGLKYIDHLLHLLMIAVPFLGFIQGFCGYLQIKLARWISGLAQLIFVIFSMAGTVLSVILMGDYGAKAAKLMQSVMLEYFYVLLGMIPGIFIGLVAAVVFLLIIRLIYRDHFVLDNCPQKKGRENIFLLVIKLFLSQSADTLIPCIQRLPVVVLLWLSIPEINTENYLFGSFYGLILPALLIVWNVYDFGLHRYKKKLFVATRKKQEENFYRDVKSVLCYVVINSVAIAGFSLALHKSFLAIWGQQTFLPLMELAAYSTFIAFLGLPYLVLNDILKYRNMQMQTIITNGFGVICAIILSVIGYKQWGAGTLLYVLCICVQMFATVVANALCLAGSIGINYISVMIRTSACVITTMVISLIVFCAERLMFTAFGGLATMLLCMMLGVVLLYVVIWVLKVFSKEEWKDLPLSTLSGFLGRFF